MLTGLRAKRRARKLLRAWMRYRDVMLGSGDAAVASSHAHLDLEAEVASHVQFLMEALPPERRATHGSGLTAIAGALNSSAAFRSQNAGKSSRFEELQGAWHEGFIFLNGLQAIRLGHGAATHSGKVVPTGTDKNWVRVPFLSRGPVRLILTLLVVALLGYGAKSLLGNHAGDIGIWAKSTGENLRQQITAEEPDLAAVVPQADPLPTLGALLYDEIYPNVQIRVGGATSEWLAEGDAFRDWTITRIEADTVRIARGDRKLVLTSR